MSDHGKVTSGDFYVFLKPDALEGTYARVDSGAAADLFQCLALAVVDISATYRASWRLPSTAEAVHHSNIHILEEAGEEEWYTLELKETKWCATQLRELEHEYASRNSRPAIEEIFLDALRALGFEIAATLRITMSEHDYEQIYCDWDMPVDKAKMTRYLVGQDIVVMRLVGLQENSALQILKEYLRRILRYHGASYNALQNYVHVSDVGGPEIPYLAELLSGDERSGARP